MTRRTLRLAVAAVAFVAGTAALASIFAPNEMARIDASSSPGAEEPSLAEMRRITDKYRDANVALAEGYIRDPANMCETAAMMGLPREKGAMGIHYVRPDLLGITAPPNPRVDGSGTHTDFRKPAILLYEPQSDGSLVLVGVENLVFAKAWKEAGHAAPPSFHGVAYDTMMDDPSTAIDEAHNFAPHHDRHVWLYRENPNGVFSPFNPRVTCEHHGHGAAHKSGAAPSHAHQEASR